MNLLVPALATALTQRGWTLTTAESCTGGLIAAACTGVSGSSEWFERGFVTYSNAAKTELLGVDADLIACHGAVSEEVALAMAVGALHHSRSQVSLAVTGIAGPTGGSASKPVGTVWLAWAWPGGLTAQHYRFAGNRTEVREAATRAALEQLLHRLRGP